MNIENIRTRHFNVMLYPESQQDVINTLIDIYNVAGILHDKDTYKEDSETHKAGELKKAHYHFVVRFSNARTVSAFAKELGIEERFIQPCNNFKASARYLLHLGKSDKYQYSVDDLIGDLKNDVIKLIDDNKTDEQKVKEVIEMLENIESKISLSTFMSLCADMGYWHLVQRSNYIFVSMLKEHNSKYKTGDCC